MLFHLVSAESPNPVKDYRTIRKELGAHNKEILEKPEYIFLSKSDMVAEKEVKGKIFKLERVSKQKGSTIKAVMPLTIYDDNDLKKVEKILNSLNTEKVADTQ